jgi:hypothetical protein
MFLKEAFEMEIISLEEYSKRLAKEVACEYTTAGSIILA